MLAVLHDDPELCHGLLHGGGRRVARYHRVTPPEGHTGYFAATHRKPVIRHEGRRHPAPPGPAHLAVEAAAPARYCHDRNISPGAGPGPARPGSGERERAAATHH